MLYALLVFQLDIAGPGLLVPCFFVDLLVCFLLFFYTSSLLIKPGRCKSPETSKCVGCFKRMFAGKLDSPNSPALVCIDRIEYRVAGVLHRIDGPATTRYYANGEVASELWMLFGEYHRYDGEAIIGHWDTEKAYNYIYDRHGQNDYYLHGARIAPLHYEAIKNALGPDPSPEEITLRVLRAMQNDVRFDAVFEHAIQTLDLRGEKALVASLKASRELI